jgi:hypothetical protein
VNIIRLPIPTAALKRTGLYSIVLFCLLAASDSRRECERNVAGGAIIIGLCPSDQLFSANATK